MPKVLMVPVHLDALFVTHDQSVLELMADFSRLPYYDGSRDVNPNRAPHSEEILSQPLENPKFLLEAGVHLHWAFRVQCCRQSGAANEFEPQRDSERFACSLQCEQT